MDKMNITIRDAVWIATLVVTITANYFSQQKAIELLTSRMESQAVESEIRRANDREILKLELKSLEIRMQRLEQDVDGITKD